MIDWDKYFDKFYCGIKFYVIVTKKKKRYCVFIYLWSTIFDNIGFVDHLSFYCQNDELKTFNGFYSYTSSFVTYRASNLLRGKIFVGRL